MQTGFKCLPAMSQYCVLAQKIRLGSPDCFSSWEDLGTRLIHIISISNVLNNLCLWVCLNEVPDSFKQNSKDFVANPLKKDTDTQMEMNKFYCCTSLCRYVSLLGAHFPVMKTWGGHMPPVPLPPRFLRLCSFPCCGDIYYSMHLYLNPPQSRTRC